MPTISGELETRTEDPRSCRGLVDFRCGDGGHPSEEAVEEIIEEYRSIPDQSLETRITREMPGGSIVGIVGIKKRGLRVRHDMLLTDAFRDAALIELLALNAPYRGRGEKWVDPHGVSLSQILLWDGLCCVSSLFEGDVPPIQAVIDPRNTLSRAMVENQGFQVAMPTTFPHLLYLRPRGLEIVPPWTDEEPTD